MKRKYRQARELKQAALCKMKDCTNITPHHSGLCYKHRKKKEDD